MKRGLGCLPDLPSASGSHSLEEVCGAGSYDIPDAVDLRYLLAPIADQVWTESCPGHAGANAICQALRRRNATAERPSQLLLWDMARGLQGRRGLNVGSTLGAIEEAARVGGFAPESAVPWDPSRACEHLFADEYQASILQLGIRSHRSFLDGQAKIDDIKAAIASGCGVAIGMDVDQSFIDWSGHGIWPGMSRETKGGHAMSVCGYVPGGIAVVNSWGSDWADGGCAWISWDYVVSEHCRSVWIVDAAPEYWREQA